MRAGMSHNFTFCARHFFNRRIQAFAFVVVVGGREALARWSSHLPCSEVATQWAVGSPRLELGYRLRSIEICGELARPLLLSWLL